ncbi:MAG: Two-component transcriptional response regulator, OmpR family [Ktedonobacterales bacterium]|jgi:two-component system response regulator ResD|nr:MAG: Two-component transcriptional response regulator, OmpR family [Ktedonobacterales bacterium]
MNDPYTSEATVLVIEDEESITRLLRLYLIQAGYRVLVAGNGIVGLTLHEREHPDLVVLDVMLPGLDGWDVCRRIRASARTPILMLTALQTEEDRIAGLDLGADDYVTKPFSPRELVSRVRAILRRTAPTEQLVLGDAEPDMLNFPGLTLTVRARRVEVDGRRVELTAKEFDLLLALARAPERVFTREELLSAVWGYDYLGDSRTVDVHIGTLRKKIERDPAQPRYIKTIWRVGYVFDPADASVAPESGA